MCYISIVSAAASQLLPVSLLNVAGFSTAAADIPDVNGVHVVVVLPACYGWLHNFC